VGTLRLAAIAALSSSLIVSVAGPASAARTVDPSPPSVYSTSLTDGQLVTRRLDLRPRFGVSGYGVTPVALEVLADGTPLERINVSGTSASVRAILPAVPHDTEVDVTIRVHDSAGQTGEATTRVRVDTEYPEATVPAEDGPTLHGKIELALTDTSPDVVKVDLFDSSGGVMVGVDDAAPWVLPWDTSAITSERRWVVISVTDRAGNYSRYFRQYRIDNVGPVYTGGLPTWVRPGINSLDPRLREPAGVDRVEWWVGGTLRSTEWPYRHDFGTTSGAVVPVTLKAWDKLGNQSTTTTDITVDGARPVVTALSPAGGALVRGSRVTSTIRFRDDSGASAYLLGGTDGHVIGPVVTSSVWTGRDGRRTLQWDVIDSVGNLTRVYRIVTVDNTAPTLKMTKAPKNKARVKGTLKVTASAWDRNGVARVELLINGKVIAKDYRAGYAFSVNTRKYGKKFKVQLRAYDRAGNARITTARTWYR
jgi:hypothetical protein